MSTGISAVDHLLFPLGALPPHRLRFSFADVVHLTQTPPATTMNADS